MRGRAVWTLLSGASVLLVSALANAQCTKDIDCKGNRVCDAGKCTSPAASLPAAPPAPPGAEGATDGTSTPASDGASAPSGQGEPAAPATPTDAQPAPASSSSDWQLQPAPNPDAALAPRSPDEPKTHRRHKGAMILGIAAVSVGPIALLGALAARNAQARCDSAIERDYPDHRLPPSERYRVNDCDGYSLPIYLFGIGGAVLTAAGIPLLIYGGKRVRDDAPQASLQVLPWAGRDSGGLRLRLDM